MAAATPTTVGKLKLGSHTPRGESDEREGRQLVVRFQAVGKAAFETKALSGHTVQVLKEQAADVLGVPAAGLTLLYNGRVLLDPFSIADFVGDALSTLADPIQLAVEFKRGKAK